MTLTSEDGSRLDLLASTSKCREARHALSGPIYVWRMLGQPSTHWATPSSLSFKSQLR